MPVLMLVLRRLLTFLPILFGVTLVTFLLSHVIPADPAAVIAGENASEATVDEIRDRLGLERPLFVQYVTYVGQLVRGDLGTSIFSGRPVSSDLGRYFAATFELATIAMVLAVVVGVLFGVLAAVHRDGPVDHVTRVFALVGGSTPVFWLALLLVLVFYGLLGWFPASGRFTIGGDLPAPVTQSVILDSLLQGKWIAFLDSMHHITLPAVTLGVMGAGVIARITRASMLDVMAQEYMRAAKAKGLSRGRVLYVHGLRNALLPTVTVAGITYGSLLGGAVLTESIFNWPGLGRYAVTAMFRQDYPALMGVVIVMTLAYAVVNLVVDTLYVVLNPIVKS